MTKENLLYDQDGWTIALTERHRFALNGPELARGEEEFDTYAQAVEKMGKVTSAQAKRVKRNLALPVLVKTGGRYNESVKITEAALTGAHASNGNLLTKPKLDTGHWSGAEFYPNVPIIVMLLERRAKLGAALGQLEKTLKTVEIEEPGYHIRDRDYDVALADLEADYASKKATAEALAKTREVTNDANAIQES